MTQFQEPAAMADASGHPTGDPQSAIAARKPIPAKAGRQASGNQTTSTRMPATPSAKAGRQSKPSAKTTASPTDAAHPAQPGSAVQCGSEPHISDDGTATIIAQLIEATRMRRRWHKAEKSLTLQGKAMCRAWFGGDKDEANKAFDLVAKGECRDATLVMAVTPFLMAREPFQIERKLIEKRMRKLSRQLPVWAWAEGVRGLGDLRLAIIVGECGDLGSYKSVSAVWKRMGLAVIDGGRQRRVAGDAALEHGYNPERRATAYVMGTEIIKAQVRNIKDDDGKRTDQSAFIGPYGEVYLTRKAHEAEREGITKAHANNRAARYMVKRVLRDLYGAWRSTETAHLAGSAAPSPLETNHHTLHSENIDGEVA